MNGSCTQPWVDFTRSTVYPRVVPQTGYLRLHQTAVFTFTDPVFRMGTYVRERDPDERVRLEIVSDHTADQCGLDSSPRNYYNWLTERICINADNQRDASGNLLRPVNPWREFVHEYGHFIQDMYGQNAGIPHRYCQFWAAHEGMADAYLVNAEHYRHNPHTSANQAAGDYEQNVSFLFAQRGVGPGLVRQALDFGLPARAPHTRTEDQVMQAISTCSEHGIPGKSLFYHHGMVISQMLWKLLNNRTCAWAVMDRCGDNESSLNKRCCHDPQRIFVGVSNASVAAFGRGAFTMALAVGPRSPWQAVMSMRVFAGATLVANQVVNPGSAFGYPANAQRLANAFAQSLP